MSTAVPLPEPLVEADEGRLGAYVRYSLYPNEGMAWLWACVVGEDRDLLATVEHALPLSDDPASLDLEVPDATRIRG